MVVCCFLVFAAHCVTQLFILLGRVTPVFVWFVCNRSKAYKQLCRRWVVHCLVQSALACFMPPLHAHPSLLLPQNCVRLVALICARTAWRGYKLRGGQTCVSRLPLSKTGKPCMLKHHTQRLTMCNAAASTSIADAVAEAVVKEDGSFSNAFPNLPGVYAIYDADNTLQYIGISRRVCVVVGGVVGEV